MPEAGQTLSHYRLVEKIGEGGMGVVWRAEDTKLRRDVALKFLPEGIARDADRLARFEREARMLAALNDSNVAAIYEMDHADGEQFLVLEYVPGVSLAERLKKGPLPLQEALKICCDLARGLEAAHAKGMIHRDLKPANVQLTPDGKVKVLDFGLAKAFGDVVAADERSQQMTVTAATGEYTVVGTVPYMSPEQASGQVVDKRTDIWAFGCILYELLTGQRAFAGETVSNTLTNIHGTDPDWKRLPAETPAAVHRVLHRCLEKDADRRVHDIADARIVIEDALAGHGWATPSPSSELQSRPSVWLRVAPWVLLPLAIVAVWFVRPVGAPPPAGTIRFSIPTPQDQRLASFFRPGLAVSPDGSMLAFVSGVLEVGDTLLPKSSMIHVRRFDEQRSAPVSGTEGAESLVFSPDGRWIAFYTHSENKTAGLQVDNRLLKVRLDGGDPVLLCKCNASYGLDWGPDGQIAIAGYREGIQIVSASGGEPQVVTDLDSDAGESAHVLPRFLPGGDAVLYNSRTKEIDSIFAYSLRTQQKRVVIEGGSDARYIPTGHLLFAREGRMMAVPFDLDALAITGPEVPVLEGVSHAIRTGWDVTETRAALLSVSPSGTLAYIAGSVYPEQLREVVWIDRQGQEEPLGAPAKAYMSARVSPDGERVLLGTNYPPPNIWLYDVERETLRRQTLQVSGNFAVWGPGTDHFTFVAVGRDGSRELSWKPIDSDPGGLEKLSAGFSGFATSWTADGSGLALVSIRQTATGMKMDIYVTSPAGESEPFLQTEFWGVYPEFSPDGKWMLYVSHESGRKEVYVRPYPYEGRAVQISTEGGSEPAWSRDGREIFYSSVGGRISGSGDRKLYVVQVQLDGEQLRPSRPKELFAWDYDWLHPMRSWDVAPDGRFLAIKPAAESEFAKVRERFAADEIQVVLNWHEELKRKMAEAQ